MSLYTLFWKDGFALCILLFLLILSSPFPKRKGGVKILPAASLLYLLASFFLLIPWQSGQASLSLFAALLNLSVKYVLSIAMALSFCLAREMALWDCAFALSISLCLTRLLFGLRQLLILSAPALLGRPLSSGEDMLFQLLLLLFALPGLYLAYGREVNLLRARFRNRGLILSSLLLFILLDLIGLFGGFLGPLDKKARLLMLSQELLFDLVLVFLLHNFTFRGMLYYENSILEALSAQRSSQYELTQELIDTINIRSHDLKKQMSYLRRREGLSDRFLKEMEDCVSEYDSILHTGHRTLDTVLTEKSLSCRLNEISFSCIANGQALSFMEELDIYTLFANLMDNAIEASLRLPKEKRAITLIVKQKDSFVSILEENCSDGKSVFVRGNPETTKADKSAHGFGTRSMRQIAGRYDGSVIFDRKGEIFRIRILLPLP